MGKDQNAFEGLRAELQELGAGLGSLRAATLTGAADGPAGGVCCYSELDAGGNGVLWLNTDMQGQDAAGRDALLELHMRVLGCAQSLRGALIDAIHSIP